MTQEVFSPNLLQNNSYTFTLDRIPQVTFRIVSCDIPTISVAPAPSGAYPGAPQYFPGNTIEFDEFSADFLVDADLRNYEEIYDWLTQMQFATEFKPKNEKELLMVSDGTLITMTNASNANRVFSFKDMFPVSLGGIHFDSTVAAPDQLTCTVNFRYSYFQMVKKP
jgi:hypothetical protein